MMILDSGLLFFGPPCIQHHVSMHFIDEYTQCIYCS